MFRAFWVVASSIALFGAGMAPRTCFAVDHPAKPGVHEVREIEGWQVKVDRRLIDGEEAKTGASALKLLRNRLEEIAMVLPADKVERLRKVPIQLDASHGELRSLQYHPSVEWLTHNGYDASLVRNVHIPVAAEFVSPRHHHTQPWCVLHELAHAYHDQVLGFDDPAVLAAWKAFSATGKYEKTRHIGGRSLRHYGLTNAKEFFAEMTEAYFGLNDFYPFHRDDLRVAEPEVFALMRKCWGDLP